MNKDKQHELSALRANGIDLTEYGPEELGRCIRDARTRLGYSQRQLASLVGRAPSNIHVIESGTCRPTTQTLESLISVLSSAFVDQENLLEKTLQKFDYIANPDRGIIDFTLYDQSRLNDLVKDARNHLKLTQGDLVDRSEVSRDTIRRIEKGESGVQSETLTRVLIQLRSAFSPQVDVQRDILPYFRHHDIKSGGSLDLNDYGPDRLDHLIRDTCSYFRCSQYNLSRLAKIGYSRILAIMSGEKPPPGVAFKLSNVLIKAFPPGTPTEKVLDSLGYRTHTIDLADYSHENLGNLLRDARQLLGYELADLSGEIEVSPHIVGDIERNETRPRRETFERMLQVLYPAFINGPKLSEMALFKFGYSVEDYARFNFERSHSFGDRLTALRRISLNTLTETGRLTGISSARIFAIEQNRVAASGDEIAILARKLAYLLVSSPEDTAQWLAGDISDLALPRRLVQQAAGSNRTWQVLDDPPHMKDLPPLEFGLTLRRLREETGIPRAQASSVLQDYVSTLHNHGSATSDGENSAEIQKAAESLLTDMEAGGAYGKAPLLPSASYLGSVGDLLDYYHGCGADVSDARRQVADWWIAKHEQRLPRLAGPDAIAARLAMLFCEQEKRSPHQVMEQLRELDIENVDLADVRAGINMGPWAVKLLDLRGSAEPAAHSELRSELMGLIPQVFSQQLICSSSEDVRASSFRPTDERRETWRKVGDVLLRWRRPTTAADDDGSQHQLLVAAQRFPISMDTFNEIEQGKGYLHLDAVEALATSGILSSDSKDIVELCRKEKEAQVKKYDTLFVYAPGPPTGYGIDLDRYSREINIVVPETEILNLPRSEATSQLRYLLNLQEKCSASRNLPNVTLQLLPEGTCENFPHHIRAAKNYDLKRYCAIDSEGEKVDWYLTEGMCEEKFHSGSRYVSADDYTSGISSNSQSPAATVARLRNLFAQLTPVPRSNAGNTGRIRPQPPRR